eukprot:SAG11_NODE_134_length_15338_cov_3.876435_19_plen_59_part_00
MNPLTLAVAVHALRHHLCGIGRELRSRCSLDRVVEQQRVALDVRDVKFVLVEAVRATV